MEHLYLYRFIASAEDDRDNYYECKKAAEEAEGSDDWKEIATGSDWRITQCGDYRILNECGTLSLYIKKDNL